MRIRDISYWQTFVQVAEQKSFVKAGNALGLGPSNVSKQIAWLENELGVRLLNRTTRSVTLSQEGETLLPRAKQLLEDVAELENRALDAKGLRGKIRLTCLPVVAHRWLVPELTKFRKKNPEVNFELDLSEKIVDLIAEQMDLAIRVQPPKGADFVFRELASNELVVCASPKYLKKIERPQKPLDLLKHSLLTLELYSSCRFIGTGIALRDLDSARAVRCEVGLFLTELALAGEGIAIRSKWDVFPFLQSGALVELLPDYKIEPFGKAYLVIPQKKYLSPRVRAFADHLLANSANLRSLTK